MRSGGLETKVTSGASVLPPPQKKEGGLVVSNRIKTKTRSHIFVSKGGAQILVLVLWVCEGDGWKGSQGREITDWVAATEAES